MNHLLTWLSTRLVIGANDPGSVIYPNFENDTPNKPSYDGKILEDFYPASHGTGDDNPGREAVNFYEAFRNYLDTSAEWEELFRLPGALLGKGMWYISEALRMFYLELFKLLRISTVSKYGMKANYNGGHWGIRDLFYDGNAFGLFIFGIILLIYVCGTTINSPTFQRYKNILRNALLILLFIVCLPTFTSAFARGVYSVSQGMLNPKGEDMQQQDPSDIANLAFEDNVVSIPARAEYVVPGSDMLAGGGKTKIYRMHHAKPINGLNDDADPVFIDLSQMTTNQASEWNGGVGPYGYESVPEFLSEYSAPEDLMNKDNIGKYASSASQEMAQNQHVHDSNYNSNSTGAKKYRTAERLKNRQYLNHGETFEGHPYLSGIVNGVMDVGRAPYVLGNHIYAEASEWWNQDRYEANYKSLFSYHVESTGPGVGANAGAQGLSSHSLEKLSGQSFVAGHTIMAKQFARSYGYFHVNWLAIYAQLGMIILIMGAYMMKLIKMIFKLLVMYVSSGLVLFRNADNYQRIKNWMRDLFSIYEMAMMDTIMIYLSLYVIYPAYHQFNDSIMANTKNVYLANPYSIAVINLICDFALYNAAIKGVNAINAMAGSSGGGANSGAGSTFGSIVGGTIAMRGAGMAFNGAKRVGGSVLGGAKSMTWGHAMRHHRDHLNNRKIVNGVADKMNKKKHPGSSNRTKPGGGKNSGGVDSDKKIQQEKSNRHSNADDGDKQKSNGSNSSGTKSESASTDKSETSSGSNSDSDETDDSEESDLTSNSDSSEPTSESSEDPLNSTRASGTNEGSHESSESGNNFSSNYTNNDPTKPFDDQSQSTSSPSSTADNFSSGATSVSDDYQDSTSQPSDGYSLGDNHGPGFSSANNYSSAQSYGSSSASSPSSSSPSFSSASHHHHHHHHRK